MSAEDEQYWFNAETKQVEKGRQSHYTHLMGPYPTHEAAAAALSTAATRNEAWEDDDERWDQKP